MCLHMPACFSYVTRMNACSKLCGLDFHRTLTHLQEKRGPMFVEQFCLLFSKIFIMIFYKLDPYFRIFFFGGGVKMGPMLTDFVCKIHPFGWHIPVYLTYVKFLPLGPLSSSCRGTQIILNFINLWNASLREFRN